ncbi:MAG TPA: HIG1 domain-containing protein [Burkholderiales bacterium]|nr:HIG1 domain-containing protein [Burkholderiales bacterium]
MTLLTAVIILAVVATAGAFASGIVSMAHGGEYDQRHSGEFMFARVGLQGLTLVLLLIALLVSSLR